MLSEGALAYVQKPYDIDSLARIVRQALGQESAQATISATGV